MLFKLAPRIRKVVQRGQCTVCIKGLNDSGCASKILSPEKTTRESSVIKIVSKDDDCFEEKKFLSSVIQRFYTEFNRTALSNTLFSPYQPGFDLFESEILQSADIIHLHWIIGTLTPKGIQKLMSLNKPVVWTLHDQWAFTGGCHYSAGCEKYCLNCRDCPQLLKDPLKVAENMLKDKQELFENPLLSIVAPSRWMADCAARSSVFKNHRIEVIPNSVETDIFSPMPKLSAREILGIEPECRTILICAFKGKEKRKGLSEFSAAMKFAMKKTEFQRMAKERKFKVLFLGQDAPVFEDIDLPIQPLGLIESNEKIRAAYNSADVFVLPSLEDNFPNTMLEAMSCGTPTIAFRTGGIPEAVIDGFNGRVVPKGDFQQLGESVVSLLDNEELRTEMGVRCREKALKDYRLNVQAVRYFDLYQDLLSILKTQIPTNNTWKNTPSHHDIFGSGDHLVPLNASIGPRSDRRFDAVLVKSLKTLDSNRNSLIEQVRGKEVEIRTLKGITEERLQLIEDLSKKIENDRIAYEEKLRLLESIEEKRKLRIEKIEDYVNFISAKLKNGAGRRLKDPQKYKRFRTFLDPRLGVFEQYPPRPLHIPRNYYDVKWNEKYPSISLVTPSLNQGIFIERTIKSVIDQDYPFLEYQVVDGGSDDNTIEILKKFDDAVLAWSSRKDNGQSNAINVGFERSTGEIMAYLNSDDMLLPGSLHYVAAFFLKHPEIDVVYGHRVVIDECDFEIGRWVIPRHSDSVLNWADYIPQETLFWRRKIWEKAGGFVDENLKFAMDWDLILRFREIGARFKRVPRFLGAFRFHSQQKTSKKLETSGAEEMQQIRTRCNGHRVSYKEIGEHIKSYYNSHVFLTKLYRAGILNY